MTAITACLLEEASAITAVTTRLCPQQVEQALTQLEACRQRRGKLVVTGVGKSGIVARKIAATFSSIGLSAIFLNPLDALHGDLGVVHSDDLALMLSNSGETTELLTILPHLKRRGTSRIALVGRLDSRLARGCDVVLDASVDREVCPLNLAPTASTAVAMAIGDALAVVFMERAGISPTDFAINHPAGSLGRQLTLSVGDLMIPAGELTPLAPETLLPKVIAHLTQGSSSRGSLGASWVHAPGDVATLGGLVTDGDLRRALERHLPSVWDRVTAAEIATADPIAVTPEVLAADALELMERNSRQPITVLPVVESKTTKRLTGLLRLHDLVQAGF